MPLATISGEVAVGRGDEAHVDLDASRCRPSRSILALLEDAEQLHLHGRGDVADLVEEERALVRELDAPRLARGRAREGALLVAEELALEQRVRQRRRS